MGTGNQARRGDEGRSDAIRTILRAGIDAQGDEASLISAILSAAAPGCSAHMLAAALADGPHLGIHSSSFGIPAGAIGTCSTTDAPIAAALSKPGVHIAQAAALPGMQPVLGDTGSVRIVAIPGYGQPVGVLIAGGDESVSSFNETAMEITAAVLSMRLTASNREDALRSTTEAAASANQAKSALLSRLSHDLRTPLSVIIGFAELLQLDELGTQHASFVDNILSGAEALTSLMDTALEISRIETGTLAMTLEVVELRAALSAGLERCSDTVVQQHIAVGAVPGNVDARVLADAHHLPDVLCTVALAAIGQHSGGPLHVLASSPDRHRVRLGFFSPPEGTSAAEAEEFMSLPGHALRARAGSIGYGNNRLARARVLVEAMRGRLGAALVEPEATLHWVELELAGEPTSDDGGSTG